MAFDKAKAIRAAEKHLAQGKVPAAIEEYKRIVEHDREDYTSLNTLGDLYVRTGKQQEAVACFKRVAEHYRVQGFALKAVAMFKKITRFTPEDIAISVALAGLYEQQGLLVEARAQYLTVGDLLARRGQSREALEVLQRVADLDPNNTEIRLRLAEGFSRENLPDSAAQAYTEAADRLISKAQYERALEAYQHALMLRPHAHAALQGLLSAHAALGTADEAAEILEQAIVVKPADLELRAMLVRAYIESENLEQAERAASDLVGRDATSYPYFFDVARLCLQQKEIDRAVALTGRVVETALTGREDAKLLEVLEEALRRDPEHIGALLLLARIYEWRRDDVHLITTLERLAEAAEAAKAEDEERRALVRLVRLGRESARIRERLNALGGASDLDEDAAAGAARQQVSNEVPTFESFMLSDDAQSPEQSPAQAGPQSASEFSWETNSTATTPGADNSFADLNSQFTDNAGATFSQKPIAAPPPSFEDFQSVDFGAPSAPVEDARERMLKQELESVDFYIVQGYTDIARDTLDLLERQHGAHAQIDERRNRLTAAAAATTTAPAEELFAPFESKPATDDVDMAFAGMTMEPPVAEPSRPSQEYNFASAQPPQTASEAEAGLDPGLAAIFDEFREAVEDVEPEAQVDFETHYNLGLAYKDIEMHDQAIEAFQQAIQVAPSGDGTPRYLQCCNMLGHCFMQKGMPKVAAMWFRKGLNAPGHTEDEYQALRYELATAYEQMGDTRLAIDTFTEVYGIDVTYRGVAEKLRELQEQQAVNRES